MNKNNSHMKTFVRTFACLGVFVLLASCQMYKIDTQMTPEKAAASIRMVCDALPSYTLPANNPGTIAFNVSSNTPWTITRSSGADWIDISPSSSSAGALISDVVVAVSSNPLPEDRTAILTLQGENIEQTVSIQITQARLGRLFVTPVPNDYTAAGGSLAFTLQANVAWEIHSNVSWITFSRNSGDPDPEGNSIEILATAAPSEQLERTATITVTAGDEEESFDVSQKAVFELTQIGDAFSAAGETKAIRLRTDIPWSITSDQSWITFDKTSGNGDGSVVEIKATADANSGVARTANITVNAGGVPTSFEVNQGGISFEIITPASTELARQGGTMTIDVNATMAWEPSTEVEGWEVKKVDDAHFTVTAPFNNKFAAKKGNVTIKGPGGIEANLELTQGVNFEFTNAEVQADGSVKIFGDQKSRVTFKDGYRYLTITLEMGAVSFDDKAQFFLCTHDAAGDSELQCQINLAGNKRLRTNGSHTEYGSTKFDITQDELNAITEYKMEFRPNAEDAAKIDLEFFYNGTSKKVHTSKSPYAGDASASGHYFFGTESAASGSTTWYIVKSCTPVFIAE